MIKRCGSGPGGDFCNVNPVLGGSRNERVESHFRESLAVGTNGHLFV